MDKDKFIKLWKFYKKNETQLMPFLKNNKEEIVNIIDGERRIGDKLFNLLKGNYVVIANPRDSFNYGIMPIKEANKILEDYRLDNSSTFQLKDFTIDELGEEVISFRQMESRLI